jgi:hypothetical protein
MAQILRGKIRWAERQLYHELERMRPLSLKLWEKGDLEATLATRPLRPEPGICKALRLNSHANASERFCHRSLRQPHDRA